MGFDLEEIMANARGEKEREGVGLISVWEALLEY